MNKIFYFIATLLVLSAVSVIGATPKENSNYLRTKAILRSALPDSFYSEVENRPVLFYSYGHYGYTWSIITKIDNDFRAMSGKVDYRGAKRLIEPSADNSFDSA